MPDYTKNYNLIKPYKSENYDVDEINNMNMDIVDAELSRRVIAILGKGLSTNDYTNEDKEKLEKIGDTKRGFTFTPTVSEEGVISWQNDGNLPNPEPVNIMGPEGPKGTNGLNATLLTIENLDDYYGNEKIGYYYGNVENKVLGLPQGKNIGSFYMQVLKSGEEFFTQILIPSTLNNINNIFIRTKNYEQVDWSEWANFDTTNFYSKNELENMFITNTEIDEIFN